VSENVVLSRTFGHKRDKLTENCIVKSTYNLYASSNIIRVIKSQRLR
jgi:hypothetical protein